MTQVRSFLFFPVTSERFLRKAPSIPADALILDLEASIPSEQKADARAAVAGAIQFLRSNTNSKLFVRINPRDRDDAAACRDASVDAVVVPSTNGADDLLRLKPIFDDADASANIPIYPIIETPAGLINLREILDADINFGGVMFGAEDFVLGLGPLAAPGQDSLFTAAYQVAVHARAYGLPPYGIASTLADVRDLSDFAAACRQARAIGMVGCPGAHPAQVEVVNQEFSPTDDEMRRARAAIEAFEAAGGVPIVVEGRMIDEPIYIRYKALLDL